MVKFDQEPVVLSNQSHIEKVNKELNEGRELNAFFLVHGYVEAYLLQWILVSGNLNQKQKFSEKVADSIERITFSNLLHVNLMLGNIDEELYEKIKSFNNQRNNFAHYLITFDIADPKIREKMGKIARNGIEIMKRISEMYTITLDNKQKSF